VIQAAARAVSRRCAALAVAAVLVPTSALAQDFQRVVPKQPPAVPLPPLTVPPPVAAPAADDQILLLPELKGVVFVNGTPALRPEGIAARSGIVVRDVPFLARADVTALLQPMLGRPLTRAGLEAIARIVREAYRAGEHPFVDVSVPPQNVASGVVQIVVTEYTVGAISVSGNRYFSSNRIRGMADLKPGETLTLPRLRQALDGYNSNPFLTVNAVAKPGGQTGATDIALEAKDRLPVRLYAGYDNQGVPSLGRDEWYVGGNWGNVFGTGQILSYQFTRSFEGRYTSHSASDVIPLGPRDRLLLFGAYAIQNPDLGAIFNSEGRSAQVSGRYVHDLPGSPRLKHSLQFGVDYKRTNNNLDFLGFRILQSEAEIFQFPLTYSATFTDRHGQTVLENTFVFSPGGITPHNDDASLNLLVPFSNATYGYDRISLTRTTFLPHAMSWIVRAMFQAASSNLPNSEQLGGGGIGSVRGYDPNTALGSNGVVFNTELRSPPFSLFGKKAGDHMQLGAFFDYANLWQVRNYPDVPHKNELASVGVNLNYSVRRNLDFQVQLGSQLMDAPFATSRATRAAVIVTIGF
jgi:hemolysin activation/secretion protein